MWINKAVPIGFALALGLTTSFSPLMRADDMPPTAVAPADQAAADAQAVTRVYDVRSLVTPTADFPLETSPHGPAFTAPTNRQQIDPFANGAGLFSPSDPPNGDKSHPLTGEERAQGLQHLIEEIIRGSGTVRVSQGTLIASDTPAVQKEIEALLTRLRESHGQTVRTSADWLLLSRADAQKLINPLEKVSPKSLADTIDHLPPTARRIHADLLSQNGQTVHWISGRERSVDVSQEAIIGPNTAAYAPVIGNFSAGLALQINAAVDRQQGDAVVTIFSTFNDAEKPGKPQVLRSFITVPASSTQPAETSVAMATYRSVSGVVQELRTTARVPLDVPVLIGAMTLEPGANHPDGRELLLVVTIRAVQ